MVYCLNSPLVLSDSNGKRAVINTKVVTSSQQRSSKPRDVTDEINRALNPKRLEAMRQRLKNDLLFDVGRPQNGGLSGIAIEFVEAAPLYIEFYKAVNHEEEWDIKRKDPWEKTIGTSFPGFDTEVLYEGNIMTPEDLGNYTYGSIGKAYGFPLVILYVGSYYAAGFPVGEDFWNNEWKDWGYITKGYFR